MLQWIKDFLTDRTQEVVLNGKKSNTIPVKSGVPQGSVLGPILFTMFVNDLPLVVSSPVYMFADDTKIFCVVRTSEDYSVLQHDLDLLYEWSICWQLKFNILKCKHMHLGPMHHYGSYYLDGTVIDNIDSYKDLGIILDHQLKFHLHTTEVVVKANRLLGLIKKSFDYLDSDMLTKLFTAFVRPTLEYSNAVWGLSLFLIKGKWRKSNVGLHVYCHH